MSDNRRLLCLEWSLSGARRAANSDGRFSLIQPPVPRCQFRADSTSPYGPPKTLLRERLCGYHVPRSRKELGQTPSTGLRHPSFGGRGRRKAMLGVWSWVSGRATARITMLSGRRGKAGKHTPSLAFRQLPWRNDVYIKPVPGVWLARPRWRVGPRVMNTYMYFIN